MEYFGDVQLVLGFEVVQIGLVLEDVDVDFTFGQCQVGAHVVGEFNQFYFIAFFLQRRFDLVFHHIAKVAHGGAEHDFGFGRSRSGGFRSGRCGLLLAAAGSQCQC